MNNTEQQFLKALDDKLWKSADKLRANLDAANYKHVVLGLIFLKYVSDAFEERQEQLIELFNNDSDDNIYYLPRDDFDSDGEYQQAIADELEVLDYYREANVFWVPKAARWKTLKEKAVLPVGTVLWQDDAGNDVKLRSVSWLIDNALDEIEKSNAKLKGILNRISQYQLDNDKLLGLINTFSDTSFTCPVHNGETLNLHSKDILGHVYEYFLGQFALAEGKQGGQYYTPKSIVTLIVEMLEPYSGRVYDPAMGSGGFFVSSDKFIEEHAKDQHYNAAEQKKHISVYGQESNPTTWKLAAMNMAIRGIDFNFGKKNADTFLDDQHPDLRADFVMANPPFNMKDYWSERLTEDYRWKFGIPARSNANFAWIQHMLSKLSTKGKAAIVLANMSLASSDSSEQLIRKKLVDSDLVDCIVNLPDKVFTSTPIGACIWILNLNKRNKGKVLFIDASKLAEPVSRTLNRITDSVIFRVSSAYKSWSKNIENFRSEDGFSNSVEADSIVDNGYSLFPSAYLNYSNTGSTNSSLDSRFENISIQLLTAREKLNSVGFAVDQIKEEIKRSDLNYTTYKLSEVLERTTEKLGDRPEPEVLTCTETAGLVFQKDRFANRVATDNTEKYKYVRKGDIVYNPYLLWAGSIDQCWIVEEGITSPAYEVFKVRDGFDKTLIGTLLKSEVMLNKYDGISVGTVKRRRRAPAEKFLELEITLPDFSLDTELTDEMQNAVSYLNQLTRSIKEFVNDGILNLTQK